MYTENTVNHGSQELLSTVSGSWSSTLIKVNTCMTIKNRKPALLSMLYELLNLIFNLRKCNSVKLIK